MESQDLHFFSLSRSHDPNLFHKLFIFFKCDPLLGRDPPIEKRRAKWLGGWCLFPTATTVFLELFCVSSHPFPVLTPRSDFWALVSAEHLVSCSSAELWARVAGNVFRGCRRCFLLWFAVIVTLNSVDPFKIFFKSLHKMYVCMLTPAGFSPSWAPLDVSRWQKHNFFFLSSQAFYCLEFFQCEALVLNLKSDRVKMQSYFLFIKLISVVLPHHKSSWSLRT